MIRAGLTGSIGSGKSTVARIFDALGYPVYYSDVRARMMYLRREVKDEVRQALGEEVFDDCENIDTRKMADVIFSDSARLQKINDIIHPRVADDFKQWAANQDAEMVIHESALIFEAGFQDMFHLVMMVSAPREERISRVMKRDKCNREKILQRMSYQWDENRKQQLADYVLNNNEHIMLLPQVLDLIRRIKENY